MVEKIFEKKLIFPHKPIAPMKLKEVRFYI